MGVKTDDAAARCAMRVDRDSHDAGARALIAGAAKAALAGAAGTIDVLNVGLEGFPSGKPGRIVAQ